MPDSDNAPLDEAPKRKKGVVFDATINLGHILTGVSMLFAVAVGWSNLDKRVAVLERDAVHQISRENARDEAVREKFEEVRTLLRDMNGTLQEMQRERRAERHRP